MSEFLENGPPVSVAVRQRPFYSSDQSEMIIKYEPKSSNIIIVDDRPYVFDKVFGPKITQQQLFEAAIKPLVKKVLNGFNCTALAYGQTGTGKSYTMGLSEEVEDIDCGIVRRCLSQIMQTEMKRYDVKVSFVEIYNEKVFDLLSANPNEPIMSKGFKYPGGIRQPIFNMSDCNEILRIGISKRHVRPTSMNTQSSRSHCIFSIEVTSKDVTKPARAYLNLVDLAGSEGVRRTGHTGQAMSEGVHINQGLLCIGKILQAMSECKKVIPFRDSVLGAVLQDSLNSNSFLTLLACISPKRIDLSETMSTIRFAQRAKQLKLTPQMNSILTELNKNKPKTPFNTKATTFVRPMQTPFKRSATDIQISNTFCTPSKERRTESHLNHTDIGLTPKEKERAQQLMAAPKNTYTFPAPVARSSTVHTTAQRESLFEQTIDSWALNASTSTVTAFEAPSCIEKPISYSPIVKKCLEKVGSVLEDKMLKVMESFMSANKHAQMQVQQTPAQNMTSIQQSTMRSELRSMLNELMSERKTKSPTTVETCSLPPTASARCQLFSTSSPVFKVPDIPTMPNTISSVLQISDDSIDHSLTNNTVRPARRSTRLQSQNFDHSQISSHTNENRNVRRSLRIQAQLPSFDDSLIQSNNERIESNKTLRKSTRRRSRSVPTQVAQSPKTKAPNSKKKSNSSKYAVYDNLFENCAAGSSQAHKTNLNKRRKAILELLNQGSMKDLQILPQVGLKTAYQIVTHRTLNGKFKTLAQVEALPMWRGNAWERFAQANVLL